jgi:hypothetical protein
MSTPSARRPAGRGLGALAGSYPDPAIGLPLSVGFDFADDFMRPRDGAATGYGERLWESFEISGGVSVYSAATPDDWTEAGILQVQTATTANRGASIYLPGGPQFLRFPPPGAVWACKMRLTSGTINYELWSGFSSSITRVSAAEPTSHFLGVRSVGANIFGVTKAGATETTVDLGATWEGSAWRVVGFEVGGTTAAPEIQFFRLDPLGTSASKFDRQDIGSPITTNLPALPTIPIAMGLFTTSTTAKIGQIDWWALGGRAARG